MSPRRILDILLSFQKTLCSPHTILILRESVLPLLAFLVLLWCTKSFPPETITPDMACIGSLTTSLILCLSRAVKLTRRMCLTTFHPTLSGEKGPLWEELPWYYWQEAFTEIQKKPNSFTGLPLWPDLVESMFTFLQWDQMWYMIFQDWPAIHGNSLVLARYEQFERINPKSISLCRGVLHRPSATEGFQSKRDFLDYNKLLLINIDVHHGVGLTLGNGFLYHRHTIPQRHLTPDAAARHLQQWRHQCAPTQVNQVIHHPRTTFGAVIVNVNKRSVAARSHIHPKLSTRCRSI